MSPTISGRGSSSSRTTPYPLPRRSSAPTAVLGASLSPLSSSTPHRPSMRSSNTSVHRPRDSATTATPPIVDASHTGLTTSNSGQSDTNITTGSTSLPTSLRATLSFSSSDNQSHRHRITSDRATLTQALSPLSSSYGATLADNHGLATLAMASSSLPARSFNYHTSFSSNTATTNQYIEHWQVASKESAKQITDLSLLISMDQSNIVTFPPHSYTVVQDAEVGQHNWFRAQACTCETYKGGFDIESVDLLRSECVQIL